MNINEYGVVFLFSTGYDMSAYTGLSIVFTKPDGTTFTRTTADGVALGVSPITTTLGIFAANKYVTYAFQEGEVDQAGEWCAYVIYEDAFPRKLISACYSFTIGGECCLAA